MLYWFLMRYALFCHFFYCKLFAIPRRERISLSGSDILTDTEPRNVLNSFQTLAKGGGERRWDVGASFEGLQIASLGASVRAYRVCSNGWGKVGRCFSSRQIYKPSVACGCIRGGWCSRCKVLCLLRGDDGNRCAAFVRPFVFRYRCVPLCASFLMDDR